MANDLSALQPILFSSANTVAQEATGFLPSIKMDFDDQGVAKGDLVKVPISPTRSTSAFTPAATSSTGADATAEEISVQITASQKTSWHLTGEQIASLQNGENLDRWVPDLMQEGMRALRNDAEAAAASAVYVGASRATGTAGTTPFASSLNIIADLRKILVDNGAPGVDQHIVMDTAASTNLLKLDIFKQANLAGSDAERRTGLFGRQYGFAIHESAQVQSHTKGTSSGHLVNEAAGYAIGDKAITVDTGTGTILAGDVVTFAGGSDKYVVGTALAANVFSLNKPGLVAAVANNDAVAVGDSYTANCAFERGAVVGIARPPKWVENPTITQTLITDSNGLTYALWDIAQYGQRTWELHLAYGFKVVKPEFVAILLG